MRDLIDRLRGLTEDSKLLSGHPTYNRVYAYQYEAWWALKPQDFKRLLLAGARGEGFDLDEYGTRMKRAPTWGRDNPMVFKMLDWGPEDFQRTLDEWERNDYPFKYLKGKA